MHANNPLVSSKAKKCHRSKIKMRINKQDPIRLQQVPCHMHVDGCDRTRRGQVRCDAAKVAWHKDRLPSEERKSRGLRPQQSLCGSVSSSCYLTWFTGWTPLNRLSCQKVFLCRFSRLYMIVHYLHVQNSPSAFPAQWLVDPSNTPTTLLDRTGHAVIRAARWRPIGEILTWLLHCFTHFLFGTQPKAERKYSDRYLFHIIFCVCFKKLHLLKVFITAPQHDLLLLLLAVQLAVIASNNFKLMLNLKPSYSGLPSG